MVMMMGIDSLFPFLKSDGRGDLGFRIFLLLGKMYLVSFTYYSFCDDKLDFIFCLNKKDCSVQKKDFFFEKKRDYRLYLFYANFSYYEIFVTILFY